MTHIYVLKWEINGRWFGGDIGPKWNVAASHDIKKLEDMMEHEIHKMTEEMKLIPKKHEKRFVSGAHKYVFTMYNDNGVPYGCELGIEKLKLV